MIGLISKKVKDKDVLWLINEILTSFRTNKDKNAGIPLGNLTSQIFANIYLNKLDRFIKHDLKIKYYIRYADDFIILNTEKLQLKLKLIAIGNYLQDDLKLQLHPKKIILRKLTRGIDFCGYVVLPHYRLPRTRTRKRIFRKILKSEVSDQSLQSYLGYFSHANSYYVQQDLRDLFGLNSRLDKKACGVLSY